MLPKVLSDLFNTPLTYNKTVQENSNFYALFTNAAGADFRMRREDLYSQPTVNGLVSGNPEINLARGAIAEITHAEFLHHLLRTDIALFLHAERLQNDIVRMTFHRYCDLNKAANGYVILTPEFNALRDRSLMKLKATETKYVINPITKAAARHNINMITYLAETDPAELPPKLKSFITARFETKF
jgi:hypothetical protein